METESQFDAKIRDGGSSKVITIPIETIEKLGLELEDILEVKIRKTEKEKKKK